MVKLSTTRAAKRLGISPMALSRYVAKGKVPAPEIVGLGQSSIHLWTEEEIENVRKLLPKIANGRKTRHKKQSAKTKAPARVPVPHKQRKPKKKK
jgi:predicted transcriptional regulator